MRLTILSRQESLFSTRRLAEAAQLRGHVVSVCDTLRFDICLSKAHTPLFYAGEPMGRVDAVIPRIGASITTFGLAVLRQFEMLGVYSVNPSEGIARSRDKLRCLQLLARHHIDMPATVYTRQADHVPASIDRVEGAPVVVKLLQGTQGIGVVLAESTRAASSVIETLHGLDQNVLIQKFIREAKGADVRAFVVGNKVVAAMRRQAGKGEFRSNLHRGGKAEAVKLSARARRMAVAAAHVLGLQVAGVDLIESNDGPMVMEVNSSPGLEGIEKATGVDVADAIIEHIEEQVSGLPRIRRRRSKAVCRKG